MKLKFTKHYLGLIVVALLFSLAAQSAEAPQVPGQVKVKILQLQLHQEQLKTEALQIQTRLAELQKQFDQTNQALTAAMDEAYTEAKADKKEYRLDPTKLEFVALPKPEPAKAQEVKPPVKEKP